MRLVGCPRTKVSEITSSDLSKTVRTVVNNWIVFVPFFWTHIFHLLKEVAVELSKLRTKSSSPALIEVISAALVLVPPGAVGKVEPQVLLVKNTLSPTPRPAVVLMVTI